MKSLPALTARDVIRVFKKLGFEVDRQKGSHVILIHPTHGYRLVIPNHPGKTIKKPLLQGLIDDAGITTKQFLDLL